MASLQIVQGLVGAQHRSVVLSCGAIRLGRAEGRIEPCHGVSFNEAGAVLGDSLSWTYPDPKHSRSEQRWITVGLSETGRVLVVSHTDKDEEVTRIISARRATRKERRFYEEG